MTRHRVSLFSVAAILVLLACPALTARADDQADEDEGWNQTLVIYLLAPTLEGVVGIGPADGDVTLDPRDIMQSLNGAFLGMYAAEKGDWGVLADIVYMDLKSDIQGQRDILSGEVQSTQTIAGLSLSYRLHEYARLLVGGMYTELDAALKIQGPLQTRRLGTTEHWIDPAVGLLYAAPIDDRWQFTGMFQYGGFGVASDRLLSLTLGLGYRFTDSTSLELGYRYLDFDYEDGAGLDRFRFDVKQHGPAVGFKFTF